MGATIELFKSPALGFDLDTKRPWFKGQEQAEAFMSGKAGKTWRSTNWNRIGDPMIAPLTFTEASGYDIGMITLETGPNQLDGIKYWFRVRDVRVNETNRTEIVYDIDFLQTFAYHMTAGHIDRVPKGNGHARGLQVNPKFWEIDANKMHHMFRELYIVFVLHQMKSSATAQSYDINGPVYCVLDCDWLHEYDGGVDAVNPLAVLSSTTKRFVLSDVVNAWIIPAIEPTGELWITQEWTGSSIRKWWYTLSTYAATWDGTVTLNGISTAARSNLIDTVEGTDYFKGTDTSEGRIMGVCDERGTVLYTFPELVKPKAMFKCSVYMSMASCEIDVVVGDDTVRRAHLMNRSFTYSARPLDVIADSWADYLFRQRAADIEGRKMQNESALAGGVGNAASGALMGAAMGSVVPGLGTAIGALAGGLTSIVGSAVNYGVQSYYGDKQQALVDKTFQLAQDTVAVNGMITSSAIAGEWSMFVFALTSDSVSMDTINAQCGIIGVPADSYTDDMVAEMNAAFNNADFLPWAGTAEVNYDMPASWKKIISAQLAAGARYKKFGTW